MRRDRQLALGLASLAAVLGGWASPSEAVNLPVDEQADASQKVPASPKRANRLEDAQAAYRAGDFSTALPISRALAEQGDAAAQAMLGFMYAGGQGVAKDDAEALKWYRRAAEQGFAAGQSHLGFMYEQGRGVAKDDVEAVKWYRKAAEQGHADGQGHLGFMYEQGRGVAKDDAEAVKWYRKAAEQGLAKAQDHLVSCP